MTLSIAEEEIEQEIDDDRYDDALPSGWDARAELRGGFLLAFDEEGYAGFFARRDEGDYVCVWGGNATSTEVP